MNPSQPPDLIAADLATTARTCKADQLSRTVFDSERLGRRVTSQEATPDGFRDFGRWRPCEVCTEGREARQRAARAPAPKVSSWKPQPVKSAAERGSQSSMSTTENRTVRTADLDKLLADLSREGKTILSARFTLGRGTVQCTLGRLLKAARRKMKPQ